MDDDNEENLEEALPPDGTEQELDTDDIDDLLESDEQDTDSSSNSDSDVDAAADDSAREQPHESAVAFDRSITGEHSYLHGAERTLRRQFIDDRSRLVIPIMLLPSVCVFPGDVVPLLVGAQHTLTRLLGITSAANRSVTFGALAIDLRTLMIACFGVVAEVRSIRGDFSFGTLISKAKQRFRVLHFLAVRDMRHVVEHDRQWHLDNATRIDPPPEDGHMDRAEFVNYISQLDRENLFAYVEMLDDYDPPQSRVRSSIIPFGSKKQLHVAVSHLEPWIYRLYDTEALANKARALLESILPSGGTSTTTTASSRPTHGPRSHDDSDDDLIEPGALASTARQTPSELSFWIAANLPLPLRVRLQLLAAPTALSRLKREIELLLCMDQLYCNRCATPLAARSDMIQMTSEGWRSAFVNPHGVVHEALTLRSMRGLRLIGRPSTESSWFPGYAWTIAECARCHSHIGWKFTACTTDLSPSTFYGVSMASVRSILPE